MKTKDSPKTKTPIFDVQQKAVEVVIEGIQQTIISTTQTVDREIFYYNFSLVGLQLYITNKALELVFIGGEKLIKFSPQIVIAGSFVASIILVSIFSTYNLIKAYQSSRGNNHETLQSLINKDNSEEAEEKVKKLNEEIGKKYKIATRWCMFNLMIFCVEVFWVIFEIYRLI